MLNTKNQSSQKNQTSKLLEENNSSKTTKNQEKKEILHKFRVLMNFIMIKSKSLKEQFEIIIFNIFKFY